MENVRAMKPPSDRIMVVSFLSFRQALDEMTPYTWVT
jgi:hypothetical protein